MNCPSCGSRRIYVVSVTDTDTRDRLRRRHCRACDHRWWTLQPRERLIPAEIIAWPDRNATPRRPPRIIPSEEDFT